MRNTIIFTSLVFIAVLVTSYWYFDGLEQRNRDRQSDTVVSDTTDHEALPVTNDTTTGGGAPLWTFDLHGGPVTAPTVSRYDSTTRFILVQDTYHILHAISPTGDKLWNAQLGGPILDSIQQLPDRSLVFTTAERLYSIDTDGDPLPGFSLRLPQRATQGAFASAAGGGRIRIDVPVRNGVLSVDGRGVRLGSTGTRRADQTDRTVHPAIDSLRRDGTGIPSGCGAHVYLGTLKDDDQLYLLCGKDDGKLYCYLWNP